MFYRLSLSAVCLSVAVSAFAEPHGSLAPKKAVPGVKSAQNALPGVATTPVKSGKKAKNPATATTAPAQPVAPAVTASSSNAIEPKLHNRSFSEYAFQVGEDQKALTLSPRYYKSDSAYDLKGTKINYSKVYNTVDITYSRAYGADWVGSVSGYLGSAEVSQTGESYRDNGFSDLNFNAQKVVSSNEGQDFHGFFVNFSPGDRRIGYDVAAAGTKKSGNGNLYSGGHSFGGYMGKQFATSEKVYGYRGLGQFNFVKKATQGTATSDLEYEQNGGHFVSGEVFAEYPQKKPVYLGVKAGLTYILSSDVTLKQTGGVTSNYTSDARQLLNFGAYGKINYSENVTVLPQVQINKQLNSSSGSWSYESQDDFVLNVGARWAL